MARPPFPMLKAAYWLLAAVVAVELLATLTAIAGCSWLIHVTRAAPPGACAGTGEQIKGIWGEALAAVLALLLAARSGNGDKEP